MKKYITYPHSLKIKEVLNELVTNSNGLTHKDAQERLTVYGLNEIPEGKSISFFLLILKQFKSWLVIILIIAAIISWFAGHVLDTWVIIAVVFINACIGFFQEYRADKAIASLKKMIVKTAKVLRDGKLITVLSSQLVPGDVLALEEGDSIPADGRIIHSKNFRTMEASLTGESLPLSKKEEIYPKDTALADRKNMVWKGTFVAGGYAKVAITGTGINTAIGSISETLGKIEVKRTNFMKKTDVLAKQMSIIAITSSILIFLVGYFYRNFEVEEILLISIAALVAAVPEGLPAVISIVLAIGANRMAKRNAIVREFTATETLGAVTAILTDKTGTLTQNSLTVKKVFLPGISDYTVTGVGWFPVGNFIQQKTIIDVENNSVLQKLLKIAAASNNSEFRHDKQANTYELIGDPTEGALSVLARKGGIRHEHFQQYKLDDLPFDSTIKLRATLIKENNHHELYVTGAPEKLLERSISILTSNGKSKLKKKEKEQIQQKISEWSNHAMRVIALAYKLQDSNIIDEDAIDNLVFVGITGMIDPPRTDSKKAVEKCKQAGIRVIMVTGDHVNTAVAIAKTTSIIDDVAENEVVALTEQQLLLLDKDEFDKAIRNISVFARLTPKMKLKIAKRLQAMGHLIAMTGDGVNDAPALKQADVGISMGIMGTDVARESSDLVLADDNFATVVNAVEEGRIVFTNSRQTSFFLVTTNIAESITLVVSILLGLPLPLTATQILWLNLVTDGVTDMALATEPGHGDIMKTSPLLKNENILNKEVLPFLFINVFLMVGLSLAAFYYYINVSIEKGRTGVFIVMAFTQLFNVYNLRSIRKSVFEIGLFSNKYINFAISISIILLILVTEVPTLATLFHFKSLYIVDLIILFTLSSTVLWAGELYKSLTK
ncbi:MAG: HAD-IC family P-type ATPase [Flavobacteriaceae bacterium]|nr:HAD-IC family P-type ATPase [Flavobacteriaceae bacterium]